jgi:hypothetical protein
MSRGKRFNKPTAPQQPQQQAQPTTPPKHSIPVVRPHDGKPAEQQPILPAGAGDDLLSAMAQHDHPIRHYITLSAITLSAIIT